MKTIVRKTTALVVLLLGTGSAAFAQTANPGMKELSTKAIGWGPILPPLGNVSTSAKAAQNISYSPARRKQIDLFASWIRQTYTPIGVLPQAALNIFPEKATSNEQIPVTSGSAMLLWVPCYAGNTTRITRAQPASQHSLSISTNALPGREPASWFNTPSQFYFTMDIDQDGKFVDPANQEKFEPIVNEVRSKIGNYLIYVTGGSYINVLLMPPGSKLPVVPVSRGEALRVAEAGIKKANARGDNPTDRMQVQLKTLQQMRETYKDDLNEPAKIRGIQFGIYTFDTTYDVFQDRVVYPLYKFSPEVYAKSRTNQPQWITISFPIPRASTLAEKEMWKAMTERFNFEYVYNYYFDPQKVKGKAYQPR